MPLPIPLRSFLRIEGQISTHDLDLAHYNIGPPTRSLQVAFLQTRTTVQVLGHDFWSMGSRLAVIPPEDGRKMMRKMLPEGR